MTYMWIHQICNLFHNEFFFVRYYQNIFNLAEIENFKNFFAWISLFFIRWFNQHEIQVDESVFRAGLADFLFIRQILIGKGHPEIHRFSVPVCDQRTNVTETYRVIVLSKNRLWRFIKEILIPPVISAIVQSTVIGKKIKESLLTNPATSCHSR